MNDAFIAILANAAETRRRMGKMTKEMCQCGHNGYVHSAIDLECYSYSGAQYTGKFTRCSCRDWVEVNNAKAHE